jgi:hypothetical protein
VVALVILPRTYFPVLAFHVGNVVLIDVVFEKVTAINLYHTQLKTFEGKPMFIPNGKILRNVLVSYHLTPDRLIKYTYGRWKTDSSPEENTAPWTRT